MVNQCKSSINEQICHSCVRLREGVLHLIGYWRSLRSAPYDILENFILTKHSGEDAHDCWDKLADKGAYLMVFIPNPGRYWGLLDKLGVCIIFCEMWLWLVRAWKTEIRTITIHWNRDRHPNIQGKTLYIFYICKKKTHALNVQTTSSPTIGSSAASLVAARNWTWKDRINYENLTATSP